MNEAAAARLRLIRTQHVGPVSYAQLIRRFGSAEAALSALPDLAQRGGRRLVLADPRAVEAELAATARAGGRYVFLDDPDYPALLAETESAPPALIVRGDAALARRSVVALVGARNASAAACRFARELAHGLAAEGIVVVSGLARGIDTAAHMGSLDASLGAARSAASPAESTSPSRPKMPDCRKKLRPVAC